jgi:hypothetical protein
VGETRVDLLHLLEDLRDAYSGPIEETILTEILANALDSGATVVALTALPGPLCLTVVDNGSGMTRRELAKYHDLAASTKTRGRGIGFAGVGIKLGLIVCEEVVTETRRGKSHVATSWRLSSRHRAPWRWTDPAGLVTERGTAVQLRLSNALSPLLDVGFVESTVKGHFAPLLDSTFTEILSPFYRHGIRFLVNGEEVKPPTPRAVLDRMPIVIRLARKRRPSAVGYLERGDAPLPVEQQGIAISTFGKVIKRGWDWIGTLPAAPDRVGGLIEAPALAEALVLNKADFIRSGARGATYLAYRKAIQEAVTRQLAEWGNDRPVETPRPAPVRLREIERVLEQLASDFPLLGALVERRRGGQRRLPWRGGDSAGPLLADEFQAPGAGSPAPEPATNGSAGPVPGATPSDVAPPAVPTPPSVAPPTPGEGEPRGAPPTDQPRGGASRHARYGLHVEFEFNPDDEELARLVDSTVRINEAHPAYRRAALTRSLAYHIGLSVALAMAPLAADAATEHRFVTQFLARWGQAVDEPRRHKR